jgi:hypothetical protein
MVGPSAPKVMNCDILRNMYGYFRDFFFFFLEMFGYCCIYLSPRIAFSVILPGRFSFFPLGEDRFGRDQYPMAFLVEVQVHD